MPWRDNGKNRSGKKLILPLLTATKIRTILNGTLTNRRDDVSKRLNGGTVMLETALVEGLLPERFTMRDITRVFAGPRFRVYIRSTQASTLVYYAKQKGLIEAVGKKGLTNVFISLLPVTEQQEPQLPEAPKEAYTHPFDALVQSITRKIITIFDSRLQNIEAQLMIIAHHQSKQAARKTRPALETSEPVNGPHEEPEPPEKKVRRPRVLIVGPLPRQQNELRGDHGRRFDLRIESGQVNNLGVKAKNADYIIGLTSFMNHSTDAILARAGTKYIRVTGGIASVGKVLDTLVPKAKKA